MNRFSNPEISILMSVFNGEQYILRALLSLLVQTYGNFELILIDDGSTDHTADMIRRIHDPRIRFYQQDNMGLTKSLNRALGMASGKWIARHDADDFSIHTRLADQLAFLDSHPHVGLLGTSCFIQPERHGIINEVYKYPEAHHDIVKAFSSYNPFVHGSMIISRKLMETAGGYGEECTYVQDYELWSRLLPETCAGNFAEPLYVRTVHSGTSQMTIDKTALSEKIRDRYNKSLASDCRLSDTSLPEIEAISFYPVFTAGNGWNRSIARTFDKMARAAHKQNLPWFSLSVQSFLYCPWFLFLVNS